MHKNPFVKNLGYKPTGLFLWNLSSFHSEKLDAKWEISNGIANVSFDGGILAMHTESELAFITPANVETFSFQEGAPKHISGFPFEYGKNTSSKPLAKLDTKKV